EDGIRDKLVTGVQTCALPISPTSAAPLADAADIGRAAGYRLAREQVVRTLTSLANLRSRELSERLEKQTARMTGYYGQMERELRSEERRVGKECRATGGVGES